MQISTILAFIDNGHWALPEFQRGYVWNRDQVRSLFDSVYRRHPIGGLLVWATESKTAAHRGGGPLAPGVVKLLLDGQRQPGGFPMLHGGGRLQALPGQGDSGEGRWPVSKIQWERDLVEGPLCDELLRRNES
jgi:hypothetical protein